MVCGAKRIRSIYLPSPAERLPGLSTITPPVSPGLALHYQWRDYAPLQSRPPCPTPPDIGPRRRQGWSPRLGASRVTLRREKSETDSKHKYRNIKTAIPVFRSLNFRYCFVLRSSNFEFSLLKGDESGCRRLDHLVVSRLEGPDIDKEALLLYPADDGRLIAPKDDLQPGGRKPPGGEGDEFAG